MKKKEFVALASSYISDLKHYLLSYSIDESLAEDLAHDCLLQAVDLFEQQRYDESKSLKSWLFCMAHSRLMDHMRKQEIHRRKLQGYQDRIRSALGWELAESHSVDRPELDRFKSGYVHRLLQTRFEDLPVTIAQRQVLQMRYLDRMTYRQIAERLHVPLSTILSRHTYAMRLVRGTYLSHRLKRRGVALS